MLTCGVQLAAGAGEGGSVGSGGGGGGGGGEEEEEGLIKAMNASGAEGGERHRERSLGKADLTMDPQQRFVTSVRVRGGSTIKTDYSSDESRQMRKR